MTTYQIEYRVPDPELTYGRPFIINIKAQSLQQANEKLEQIKQSLRIAGTLVQDAEGLHLE
jgi:hypothetical protein